MQGHYSDRRQATSTLAPRQPFKIDLERNTMTVADSQIPVSDSSNTEQILARYLAVVYDLRGLPVGDPITFRQHDLEVLSTALEINIADTEARLQSLVGDKERVVSSLGVSRSRWPISLAGVVLGVCSAGLLVANIAAAPETGTDISTASIVTVEIVTDIGNGGAIEVNPGS